MASPTQWTWVWVNSWSWWWTRRLGVLHIHGVTKSQTWLSYWTELNAMVNRCYYYPQFIHAGSLGWKHPQEKGRATPSSILAWKIPWTEECGRLQSMGSQRVGHNWATFTFTFQTKSQRLSGRWLVPEGGLEMGIIWFLGGGARLG